MKANVKTEHHEAPRPASPVALFSEWVQQGTESFFAAQRILLDLVMRQNAMAMNTLRERFAAPRGAAATVTELAGEGMTNFIAAQKILLHLAERQNDLVLKGIKERVGARTPAAAMTDMLRRSVETFINLQKHSLEVADTQTDAWVEAAKTGKAFTGKGVAVLAREGMEYFAETQKKFLDEVAKETAKAAERAKRGDGAEKEIEPTALVELAKESADAFVDAQKKLLDTAAKQVELNLKAARKTMDVFTPLPAKELADLTRQGVESFVAAQKALLDVMTKPRNGASHPGARRAHAEGPRVHAN